MKKNKLSIAFQTNKTAQDYINLARFVNQYDFDVVSVYCDAPFQPSFGPLLLMAPYLEKACLGPAAISPSRIHPMDIAANTALLAGLAKGGVYVGIARGAWLESHAIRELKPPLQTIKESVDVVNYFLNGKTGGYKGDIFQIAEHVQAGYPLPEQRIPVLIGTWGKKLCGIAGEIADEVKVGGSANPDLIPVIADYIREGEIRAGRDAGEVGIVIGAVCVVDEDRDAARELARREVSLYLPVVAALDPTLTLDPEWISKLNHHVEHNEFDNAARLIPDDLLDRFAFSGNPDDIIRQCESLFSAGANRIEFGTPHGLNPYNGIKLLGEKVLPNIQSI